MRVRVPDMSAFVEKELLAAFHKRDLAPVWVEAIKTVAPLPPVAEKVLRDDTVVALAGDWRTDDSAPRKFWLSIEAGVVRLHTTRLGHWAATRLIVLEASPERLRCGPDQALDLHLKHTGTMLTVRIDPPSAYQGQFNLERVDK